MIISAKLYKRTSAIFLTALAVTLFAGTQVQTWAHQEEAHPLPPEPVVNHSLSDAQPGQKIEHGELILDVDEAKKELNAQHHSYNVLETRRVPGPFQPPAMTDVEDFALSKSDLDVINPGPGEYVQVMEGQRHGYETT